MCVLQGGKRMCIFLNEIPANAAAMPTPAITDTKNATTMITVKDVTRTVKALGELVKNTREIIDAVNDSRKYLAKHYPETKADFGELIGQMEKTIAGLAVVSGILSQFRFTLVPKKTGSGIAAAELVRFNNYLIDQHKNIQQLKNDIRKLKGNCETIRQLRDKLDASTKTKTWGSLFGLLGEKQKARIAELNNTLSQFYADDQRMISYIEDTLRLAEKAIKEIGATLGPPGQQNIYQLSEAAAMLGTYAVVFEPTTKALNDLADEMNGVKNMLLSDR